MRDVYPKLHEYAEMDVQDPKLAELAFNSFARQIIRAGSMSHANWEYPLRSDRPYEILLPDLQSQRGLAGRGMTAWIKQRLAENDVDQALVGIRSQFSVGRHCAATPVIVCNLVGLALANLGFDNLELVIQRDEAPNLYWSLAVLPPTLVDLGETVRWELWASPTRLKEPLPPVGDEAWQTIARDFVQIVAEYSEAKYTEAEGRNLQKKLESRALMALQADGEFSDDDIAKMKAEERVMRYIHMTHCRFQNRVQTMTYMPLPQLFEAMERLEKENEDLKRQTGAKEMPLPASLPRSIIVCRTFERRVKFLQTIEAIRDYAGKNKGQLPAKLEDLELAAPNDPFTNEPFEYVLDGNVGKLRQAEIPGFGTYLLEYELTVKQ
jgi:hypothetical protein